MALGRGSSFARAHSRILFLRMYIYFVFSFTLILSSLARPSLLWHTRTLSHSSYYRTFIIRKYTKLYIIYISRYMVSIRSNSQCVLSPRWRTILLTSGGRRDASDGEHRPRYLEEIFLPRGTLFVAQSQSSPTVPLASSRRAAAFLRRSYTAAGGRTKKKEYICIYIVTSTGRPRRSPGRAGDARETLERRRVPPSRRGRGDEHVVSPAACKRTLYLAPRDVFLINRTISNSPALTRGRA